MQKVINCDSVFEILTQAPFPSGGPDDEGVERHLQVCQDCRALAEALQPAVGLFHETLASDESLPRYTGRFAKLAGVQAARARRKKQVRALLAASIAASLLLWFSQLGPQFPGASPPAPPDNGFSTLSSLRLPRACHQQADRQLLSGWMASGEHSLRNGHTTSFVCCTQCHRTGGTGPATARAVQALQVACAACHRSDDSATAWSSLWRAGGLARGKSLG